MQELAEAAGGNYYNINGGKQVVDDVYDVIDGLDKTKDGDYTFTEYANHFQLFLGIGVLLLIIEFFLSDRKPGWVEKITIFETDEKA